MTWFWLHLVPQFYGDLLYASIRLLLKHFSAIELLLFESFVVFSVAAIYFVWRGDFHVFICINLPIQNN